MIDWKKERCKFFKDFLRDYITGAFGEFNEKLKQHQENFSTYERLIVLKERLNPDIGTLKAELFSTLSKNFRETVVLENIAAHRVMNFLKKIDHNQGPGGIIKIGDIIEYDPSSIKSSPFDKQDSFDRNEKGKILGFVTNKNPINGDHQDIIVAKEDGRYFYIRSGDSDFAEKYKISRT